jgi:hypothetical protein
MPRTSPHDSQDRAQDWCDWHNSKVRRITFAGLSFNVLDFTPRKNGDLFEWLRRKERVQQSSSDHGSLPSPFPVIVNAPTHPGPPRDLASRFSANGGGANPTFESGPLWITLQDFVRAGIPMLQQQTDLNSTALSVVEKCLALPEAADVAATA